MCMDEYVLMPLSALGVYFHGVFVSLTFGLPVAIGAMLWKWWRSGEVIYLRAARIMTAVLAVNFALGAIFGTLVEFGLVQVWPGVNLAIATFAFTPLVLELIAFSNEVAFLILFIVTLGKVRPPVSLAILAVYAGFAYFSGVLITAVNTWMQAPWGTGPLAQALYPFMPEYGPLAIDVPKIVALKVAALAAGHPISILVQQPGLSGKVGVVLTDHAVAMYSPYALVSIFHNIIGATLIGLAVALAGWSYRYFKTGDGKYLKIITPIATIFAVLFVIQAPIVAHFMGEAVAKYNPTKFALIEGAKETYYNPLIAWLAYGDPNHPIVGFDRLYASCEKHGDTTLGDVAAALGLGEYLSQLGDVDVSNVAALKLRDLCVSDLQKAESRMPLLHSAYYVKVTFAILGGLAAAVLFFNFVKAPGLTALARKIVSAIGGERRGLFLLALLTVLGTVIPAVAGWAVREIGRKPWSVYGLLYPSELVTPVPYATSPGFLAFAYLTILAIGFGGLYAMYLVATREFKFLELLKKGAGVG